MSDRVIIEMQEPSAGHVSAVAHVHGPAPVYVGSATWGYVVVEPPPAPAQSSGSVLPSAGNRYLGSPGLLGSRLASSGWVGMRVGPDSAFRKSPARIRLSRAVAAAIRPTSG